MHEVDVCFETLVLYSHGYAVYFWCGRQVLNQGHIVRHTLASQLLSKLR
jgi:hypothetical protein